MSGRLIIDGTGVTGSATAYLWDLLNAEIVTLLDDDSDGVPDTLGTVFASAALFPGLLEAGTLGSPALGILVTSTNSGSTISLNTRHTKLVDGNADGVADTSTTYRLKDVITFGPLFLESPRPDDTVVEVRGTVDSTVEVWESDEEGNRITLLGSASIVYETSSAVIALTGPLEEGEFLVLRDLTLDIKSNPREVVPEEP